MSAATRPSRRAFMEMDQPCFDIKNDSRKRMKRSDGDGDRISALPDDVLLDILQCLDLRTAVRAGTVARRWRCLPRMLPDLDLDIATLVPHRGWSFSMDSVMATYTNAVTWFLLPTHHHRTSLRLAFYLVDVDPCLRSIANAIAATSADRLELTVRNDANNNFVKCGRCFASFLEACPTTFARLTSIALHDFFFTSGSEIAGLLDACHLLEFLSLKNCNRSALVVRIDAPRSSLLALELHNCFFLAVDLVRIPKLERFVCDATTSVKSMCFGSVPCLHTINLSARNLQCYFKNLASLSPAFHSLIDVYLCKLDITKMDLILSLLQAAPFLENLYIEASHHSIINRGSYNFTTTGERPKFEHRNLSSLEIRSYGISKDMDMMNYIKVIRKHAVCLKRIHLLEQCEYIGCDGVTCSCQVKEERKKILRGILSVKFSTSVEINHRASGFKKKNHVACDTSLLAMLAQ